MDNITLVAIAIGLSFDTFAVSLSAGVVQTRIRFFQAVRIGLVMAFFQAGFTVVGYFLGEVISREMKAIDHWVAFGLLFFLGSKMFIESLSGKNEGGQRDMTKLSTVLTMAIGTSIDAFAVGISFAFLNLNIWSSSALIGVVTFISSMTAIRIGKEIGRMFGRYIEAAGGIILVAIGTKILIEHLLM